MNDFINKVIDTYNSYINYNTPFSLIKIGFDPKLSSGGYIPQEEIIGMVRQNFRDKDSIVSTKKGRTNCTILLQESTFQEALVAATRLVYKAYSLAKIYSTQPGTYPKPEIPNSRIEIWNPEQGAVEKENYAKFEFKDLYHFILSERDKMTGGYREYLRQEVPVNSSGIPLAQIPENYKEINIRV